MQRNQEAGRWGPRRRGPRVIRPWLAKTCKKYWVKGKKVIITDKSMGVSQLLGARPDCPSPTSMPMPMPKAINQSNQSTFV